MISEALFLAIVAAIRAGRAINEIYDSSDVNAFNVQYKSDNSPITIADQNAHDIIINDLSEFSKDHNIYMLSEEGQETDYLLRKDLEYSWLIDPLDGTKEFIKRSGEFTVNIALMQKSVSVASVVYAPAMGCFYFAQIGSGAFKLVSTEIFNFLEKGTYSPEIWDVLYKNSIKLPIKKPKERPFTIVGSRSHGREEFDDFVVKMEELYGNIEIVNSGSSLKLCLVAEDVADIYPRFGPTMEWDTAAGQCVLECSGGIVVAMDSGEPLMYNKPDLLNPWFIAKSHKQKMNNDLLV